MTYRDRWIAALLALAGIGLCLMALGTFFSTIVNNGLGWTRDQSAQDYYLSVGRAYSQGFSVGFFLCFFLLLMAMAFRSWYLARVGATHDPEFAPRGASGEPASNEAQS